MYHAWFACGLFFGSSSFVLIQSRFVVRYDSLMLRGSFRSGFSIRDFNTHFVRNGLVRSGAVLDDHNARLISLDFYDKVIQSTIHAQYGFWISFITVVS